MDLLNGNQQVVLHTIGDHSKCGPSCKHRGQDRRKKPVLYERLVGWHGDPKTIDERISLEGLQGMDRNQLIKELEGRNHGLTVKQIGKLSTVRLRKLVAKSWGLDGGEL